MAFTKNIRAYGLPMVLTCDGQCNKAWGRNSRPRTDNSWDSLPLLDGELGDAPPNPGTYEGGDGKPSGVPLTDSSLMNKWCFRECERSTFYEEGEEPPPPKNLASRDP